MCVTSGNSIDLQIDHFDSMSELLRRLNAASSAISIHENLKYSTSEEEKKGFHTYYLRIKYAIYLFEIELNERNKKVLQCTL